MEDKQIVDLYWARDEAAIAETDRKYGRYCHYIAYQIVSCHEDAEEIVNDTWLRTWNAIPPQRPDPLKPFIGAISRNLALDVWREKHAEKRDGQVPLALEELSDCVSDPNAQSDVGADAALADALNRFLRSLPAETRSLFVRRYFYMSPLSELARDFGMKESGAAMRLLRVRRRLADYLKKEGFDV